MYWKPNFFYLVSRNLPYHMTYLWTKLILNLFEMKSNINKLDSNPILIEDRIVVKWNIELQYDRR